ncbi:MAG: LETM1-related biofilm-associated protein [Flavobacteriaceae bacterium]
MNPSATGWIDKFGSIVKDNEQRYPDFRQLYGSLKQTGFVYGINVKIPRFITTQHSLSQDEKAKINLLTGLYYVYHFKRPEADFESFLNAVFNFYKELGIGSISFLNKILTGKKTSAQLEKLIDSRVYLEDNVISKTFNSIITNSLLFVDVLTFKAFLDDGSKIKEYAQKLEYIAINVTYHALHSKEENKSDKKLLQLFESSLTFISEEQQQFDGSYRDQLLNYPLVWEKRFLLDIVCLTLWEDKTLEYQESEFLYGIGTDMGFSPKEIRRSIEEITTFFEKNAKKAPFLNDSNMAMQFYDSMSRVVNKLILRNSKRLQKELSESKELMNLISKSTVKDLSVEEKKKVQNQLLDIFKSIPSLAIFILPGGAVLLPIFIKLIPQLLPSSFDDNRIEKKQ